MDLAIKEARKAYIKGEVPVGAVLVKGDEIIAKSHNLREILKDSTAHAEVLAIREGCRKLKDWRLTGCDLYITLEPCPMCAGAIAQARINRVFIGTADIASGSCGSIINILQNEAFNNYVDIVWMYNKECSDILMEFFKERRKEKLP
ncbi:nucleoside deaminase [Clostridium sp. DL1XJH146]